MATRFVELGHPVEAEFSIKLGMTGIVTTYLDSPFHRYPERADLSSLPLEAVAGIPAMVLESVGPKRHAVSVPFHDSQARGKAILIRTGWDERWGTDAYWEPGPYLHEDLVFRLIRARVKLVGVDFPNIDDADDPEKPAHTQLLAKDILIVEHMCNLKSAPKAGFKFYAVPLRILRGASCPVRAFGEITA